MPLFKPRTRLVLPVLAFLVLLTQPDLSAGEFFNGLHRMFGESAEHVHRQQPRTGVEPCMETLARQVDWLEHHIDRYGTIVAKQPNVWGEARLMRHRDEFERQMLTQLGEFKVKLNASLRRSDQAYVGMALALQAAVAGNEDIPVIPGAPATNTTNVLNQVTNMVSAPFAKDAETGGTSTATQPAIDRTGAFALKKDAFSFQGGSRIFIEPTVELDQMARYLNHLHELRRLNEGDDTGDSPGYSLNLVRIPVSVVTGSHTRTGCGAEITVTAEPYLSEELLPTTFRTLVINDLVEQLALPVTRLMSNEQEELENALEPFATILELETQRLVYERERDPARLQLVKLVREELTLLSKAEPEYTQERAKEFQRAEQILGKSWKDEDEFRELNDILGALHREQFSSDERFKKATKDFHGDSEEIGSLVRDIRAATQNIEDELRRLIDSLGIPTTSPIASRRARLPVPPSQLVSVYGKHLLLHLTSALGQPFQGDAVNRDIVHVNDVQAFLLAELQAAYELLSQADQPSAAPPAANPQVWNHFCTPQLAHHIRLRNREYLDETRDDFVNHMLIRSGSLSPVEFESASRTAYLAWAIIVNSALLQDRLVQDMRETAAAKGAFAPQVAGLPFVGPYPSPDARYAFMEYVKCRWPIHVFALDPVTQDQNVADEFSRRREMQLALALAFASGNLRAQSMMRYARRLEWDMATIALNRTAVGFSHGSDTFGWRFSPRFQTPPMKGNLATFGETLFGGPARDQDIKHRQLEEGIRECTAIVLMPSFVPYCTFETRANWFRLTNPKQTEISLRDTMELSRVIAAMQQSAAYCGQCQHLYRDGELGRLLRRVNQLERELPLQTMRAQIPYENTSGGFELFNTGITDLGPELHGWYGAPGLHPDEPTTLYLVGDHFSVHDTCLMAGGQSVEYRLLSRQLLEARFPAGLRSVPARGEQGKYFDAHVDAHIMTPYGVSGGHLLIPVVRDDSGLLGGGPRWKPAVLNLSFKETNDGPEFEAAPLRLRDVAIRVPASMPLSEARLSCSIIHGDAIVGEFVIPKEKLKIDNRAGEYYVDANTMRDKIKDTSPVSNYLSFLKKRYGLPPTIDLRIEATREKADGSESLGRVRSSITVRLTKASS